jgi:cephalosporin hydroxylase
MTLDELSLKHDTDKGSSGHFYTRYYERIFETIRLNVESVLEVGVGSGASLRMWREYFPAAMIYGVDMNHNNDMGAQIKLYECEQTDCDRLREQLQDKKLEVIIEDASHDQEKTMKTLECLWPILETKGWYVIEDMCCDSFPPEIGRWYGKRPEQIRELHLLKNRSGGSLITFIKKQ